MAANSGAIGAAQSVGAQRPGGPTRLDQVNLPDSGFRPLGDPAGPSFGDVLKGALGEVSALQDQARDAISAFLRGEPVELHEVMAATEEAGIALDLLIEMRNKLTEAYRQVMNMQG